MSLIETQLEGMFRSLYQASTQSALKFDLPKYTLIINQINELIKNLEDLESKYSDAKQKEEKEIINSATNAFGGEVLKFN